MAQDNLQAEPAQALAALDALPWAQTPIAARQVDRGHGRVTTRTISVMSLDPCPDAGGEFFPHAAQASRSSAADALGAPGPDHGDASTR